MKNNNWIWILIGVVVLIVILTQTNLLQNKVITNSSGTSFGMNPTFYDSNGKVIQGHKLNLFSIIAYSGQCSLPTCPSGYSSTGTSCDDTTYVCTQTCQQVVTPSCGSYGSYSAVKSGTFSSINTYGYTPYYSQSSSSCYKEYGESSFTMTGIGSGGGTVRVYASTLDASNYVNCVGSGSTISCTEDSDVMTYMPGSFQDRAGGKWSIISGISSYSSASGTIKLFLKSASYTPGGTYNTQTTCAYTPPPSYMTMNVQVQNTGNVAYQNVQIVNATPSLFSSSLPTNVYSLPPGQSGNWTTSQMDIRSWQGTNINFDIWISGLNTYTNQTEYAESKATYGF